ncbi:MAG: hypothetical protein IKW46_08075 [Bacteroidaceae bacterium]|nr:hypothetical protein [Bacteroidaceae bacterium]
MALNLRLPNINGLSEKEQLAQIRSYLHQLVGELEFAFSTLGTSSDSIVITSQRGSSSESSANMSGSAMFSVLKPLIIKSADIVEAYYDKISKKLEGVYVAQSDFGTYTEQTAQNIDANSKSITQNFTSIQTISTDVQGAFTNLHTLDSKVSGEVSGIKQNIEDTAKGLSDSLKDATNNLSESISSVSKDLTDQIAATTTRLEAILTVDAYTRSGELYINEEGLPVYGFEVGQTNTVNGVETFRKFARFTAERLSFYDQNNDEVAYISDYKLFITSVEILYNLIGGGFILDFSRGFTLKFAGGE